MRIIISLVIVVMLSTLAVASADVNSDGLVNVQDLMYIATQIATQEPTDAADANTDGSVNIADLLFVARSILDAPATPRGFGPTRTIDLSMCDVWISQSTALQPLIDTYPAHTIFCFRDGTHHLLEISPLSGNTFIGEFGATLSGAKPLLPSAFTKEQDYWVIPNQTHTSTDLHTCERYEYIDFENTDGTIPLRPPLTGEGTYRACSKSVDLFMDGKFLWRVNSLNDLRSGGWYFDEQADKIYLYDNPQNHTIETSIGQLAFHGHAANVTIKNLIIEKYANYGQLGAIHAEHGEGWIVENNEVRYNHGAAVSLSDTMIIRDNYIHHNGQIGITGVGTGRILIEHNEIAHNNVRRYDWGWEGGGMKLTKTDNLVVRDNYVHRNLGAGIWTDIDNKHTIIEDNVVEWNANDGIKHEISYDARIQNNDVRYNGYAFDVWLWGANILIQNSPNTYITNNTVVVGEKGHGVAVVNQQRGEGAFGDWTSLNGTITANDIYYEYGRGFSGIVDDTDNTIACGQNAYHWSHNNYYHPSLTQKLFEYCGELTWDEWRDYGNDQNGTLNQDNTPPPMLHWQ